MLELIEANWVAFVGVLLLGLAVAWWIWGRRPAERVRAETPDVLTPGAAPAQRNTALVEAPTAASLHAATIIPPMASIGMAGLGEVIAAGAAAEVAQATRARAQEEGGQAVGGLAAGGQAAGGQEPDDLTRIKGVGPKLVALLGSLAIVRYDQIAGWSEADIARIDPQLGAFQGRIVRDDWVGQCRYLAAGDVAGFEGRFGKV